MDESTAIVECNTTMDASSESSQAHNNAEHFANEPYQTGRPSSPMEGIKREEASMNAPMTPSNTSSPIARHKHTLKGSKSTNMLHSVATPHPLSLSSSHNSLHHFQNTGAMYTSSPAPDVFGSSHNNLSSNGSSLFSPNTPIGPLSAPSSPSFPSTALPSSVGPSSFMAMHGHNTSLYEPFRRNSVPILNVDQTEHKRKVSEEKHMHRQGSWSAMSSSPSMLNGPMHSMVGIPPPMLHHLDAAQLDPATMHYYRTQFSQQHVLQQHHLQHGLNQVMPSPNANNCPSPLSDNFMSAHAMNNGHSSSGPGHHSSTGAIRGSSKVKRNNSICSTTSVSSTGSGSNNKHPCKFPSCEWSFKRYEHLKRHMLVHTKERPFQCDFTGCNKSFSRSDNFSAHLRTHSKKALAHRRYDSRGLENGTKQEPQDSVQSMPPSTEQHSAGGIAGFIPQSSLHLSGGYSSGSSGQEASDYGREYSPPMSPGGTPVVRPTSAIGTSSSMNDDDSFDMINHSSYSFGNNSIYSLDHLDHLNNMVPRFGTIRLDLKSVAPSDMHKTYEDEIQSEVLLTSVNTNGESPRASPMPQYDQFTFPSSISTHFMPMMPTSFSSDQSDLQQQSQQTNIDSQPSHETMTPGSYSADSFHHTTYHSDNDLKSLHYSPSPPSNEDSSHLHHPQPHHHSSYEAKAANPQMLHHASYPSLPSVSTSAALPPHPLMSMSSSPAPGSSEPLYSSSGSQAPHKGRQQSMAKLQLKQQQRQAQTA